MDPNPGARDGGADRRAPHADPVSAAPTAIGANRNGSRHAAAGFAIGCPAETSIYLKVKGRTAVVGPLPVERCALGDPLVLVRPTGGWAKLEARDRAA